MNTPELHNEEKMAGALAGMPVMILNIVLYLIAIAGFFWGIISLTDYLGGPGSIAVVILSVLYWIIGFVLFFGLKVLKPNEAYVLTLFGKYYGTLKGPGFYFVNPFVTAAAPESSGIEADGSSLNVSSTALSLKTHKTAGKKISLKALTLNNDKQKINDLLGNPIEIGIVVIWRVVNTAKAVFNVDNYSEYLSMQCDSALRNIVRMYPYDITDAEDESSLRGSSEEVAARLKEAIQSKVDIAGLEIAEARITHLAYAQEIAAAMLQRQQASAIIDARAMIVDGAVGMVELALDKLNRKGIVNLDEERKAAMVSNLMVVLCSNKDAQPIVNSGSLY